MTTALDYSAQYRRRKNNPEDLASEYRFYRFVTKRLKVFDERELGGAIFVTAAAGRD